MMLISQAKHLKSNQATPSVTLTNRVSR